MSALKKKNLVYLLILSTSLLCFEAPLSAAGSGKGDLVGFIFESDGTTPVENAVVKLKNLASSAVFEGSKSNPLGAFRVERVDQGLYIFGVSSPMGNFNADAILGIAADTTARLSVALAVAQDRPVDPKEKGPDIKGEKWIGRVFSYDAESKEARVYIGRDKVEREQLIHVYGDRTRGSETDFYQKAKIIKQNNLLIDKAESEDYFYFTLERPANVGDWVYILKPAPLAFFLSPVGVATVLGGTTIVIWSIIKLREPCSRFRY